MSERNNIERGNLNQIRMDLEKRASYKLSTIIEQDQYLEV
jgi:hypothetical protein